MTPAAGNPLVLIGLMATGKSTVGRALAARHGWNFVDTDAVIVDRHGPIPAIFARQGEPAFRRIEAEVVAEVLAEADGATVVSLGGGSVLHGGTRRLLEGTVVAFLDADLATVLPRLAGDTGRPLLKDGVAETWARLDAERRPLYEDLADVVIDTRGASIDTVVDRLEDHLRIRNFKERGISANDR